LGHGLYHLFLKRSLGDCRKIVYQIAK
jgi:hypothetical protein